jgi:hypothetical protein
MKEKTLNIIFIAVWICILASWFYYEVNKRHKIVSRLAIEYPLIEIDEYIYGRVTRVYPHDPNLFRINTNSHDITINNTMKRRLNVDDEIFTGKRLHDVLAIGDKVLKQSDSTTISIFKIQGFDTLEYRFPLLNEKLHPLKK